MSDSTAVPNISCYITPPALGVNFKGNIKDYSNLITGISSTAGIIIGMLVNGDGIQSGTTVTAIKHNVNSTPKNGKPVHTPGVVTLSKPIIGEPVKGESAVHFVAKQAQRTKDYAPFMSWSGAYSSSTISQNFGRQGDTASIVLVDDYAASVSSFPNVGGGGTRNPHFYIKPFSEILVIDNNVNAASTAPTNSMAEGVLFAGLITNPKFYWRAPGLVEWVLDCVDYTYLADNASASGLYVGQHISDIIIDLTQNAECGISAQPAPNGRVYPTPITHYQNLGYDKLTNHWDALAKAASGNDVWGWYVDYQKQLWFYGSQAHAPIFKSYVTVTDTIVAPVPSMWECHVDSSQEIYYEYDTSTFYTRCVVEGASTTHSYTLPTAKKNASPPVDSWRANGHEKSWVLSKTPDVTTANIVASEQSIKKEQSDFYLTIGRKAYRVEVWDATRPATSPFYLQENVTGAGIPVWALHTNPSYGGFTPSNGQVVSLWYKYMITVHAASNNVSQQRQLASLPNGGKFTTVVKDQTLTTVKQANLRAASVLKEYSEPQERITFYTDPSWIGVFRVGQTFVGNFSTIPNSDNGYQLGIYNTTFFIIQQQITFKDGGYRSCQVTAIRHS